MDSFYFLLQDSLVISVIASKAVLSDSDQTRLSVTATLSNSLSYVNAFARARERLVICSNIDSMSASVERTTDVASWLDKLEWIGT